jgi:hypothetical protein
MAGGGQEDSVRRAQLGSSRLATKYLELVAEHEDLEFLELLRTAAEQDQREHASDREVDECELAQPCGVRKLDRPHESTRARRAAPVEAIAGCHGTTAADSSI